MLRPMLRWASVTGAVVFVSAATAFAQSTGRFPDAPPTPPPPAPAAPAPVAPAPVAPAPVAPAPVVPPPYWQSPPPAAMAPPREPEPEVKGSGVVFVPRVGFRMLGGGEIGTDCTGDCSF